MKSSAGEVIKALHKKAGVTQREMAEKFGISLNGYHSYLEHEVKFDTFLKIVDALGYHVEIRPGALGYVAIRGEDKTREAEVLDFYEDGREEFDERKVEV